MDCRVKILCYFLVSLLVIGLLILGAWWRVSTSATSEKFQKRLSAIDQDPTHWLGSQPDKPLIPADQQAQMAESFKRLYFSPWRNDELAKQINAKIFEYVQFDFKFWRNKGYMFTSLPFTTAEFNKLVANIDMSGFPQINRPAIITHVISLRTFPTPLPDYISPHGYPFDNWISSYLFPGTPIKVLQRSKDHLWYLVINTSAYGWIPATDFAFVDAAFMTEWQKHPFAVASKDGATPGLRIGMLYPMVEEDANSVKILLPSQDENGNARLTTASANRSEVLNFPIPATARNIAEIAKQLIGLPYGWGGLYEFRDCSSTVEDILAGFGIWLPRNSTQQGRIGQIIPLTGKSKAEKRKIILAQGVPFVSLVHFPGHVTLYIGSHKGDPYVEQAVWSVHTIDILGRSKSVVIGKTVISSLELAKNFSNVKGVQLDRVSSINIYNNPESYQDEQAILKKVWQLNTPG